MVPILWLLLLLQGLQGGRSNAPQARGSIEGRVVRSGVAGAGAPQGLADARVELKPGNVSLSTGPGGTFNFRNLAPGRYTISFTRDGFVPQEDRKRGITTLGLSITVANGQILKGVVLPMIPTPVILGRVVDPHGEPLATALVSAYRRQFSPFGTQLKIVRKGMTNDLGEFRLFGLNFGDHFVSAGYSDRDRASAIGKIQLSSNVSKPDEGYATIFFDGAEDISRAQAARLAPGIDSSPLNIVLRDLPRFAIRGQVLPLASGTKIFMAPKGSDLAEAEYFIYPNSSGAFEVRGVSRGSYLLFATAEGDVLQSDVVAVNVTDDDINGIRLTLQQTVTIYGGIFIDRSLRTELEGLHVKLVRSTTEFDQTIDVPASPGGEFILEHVAPLAEYDVVVEPLPPGVYIRSMSSGGRSILYGRSRLIPDQRVQIALASATDDVEVHVIQGRDPSPGVLVVLIPDPVLRRRPDRYITAVTGDDGNALLTGVPPGRYLAYAFEQIERGAYYAFGYNPTVETRFADHAVPVIVEDRPSKLKPIELRVIRAAETAGGFN
jgi:Carboxypeptidase regulatory-like domain